MDTRSKLYLSMDTMCTMDKLLFNQLINSVEDYVEFGGIIDAINKIVGLTLSECIRHTRDISYKIGEIDLFKIDSVIDFLHDELNTGHWSEVPLPTRQCFTIANYVKCLMSLRANGVSEKSLKSCLLCLDMGLLLGAPLDKNNEILTKAAKILTNKINKLKKEIVPNVALTTKRSALSEDFLSLKGKDIDSVDCPAVECFNNQYFVPQKPVKLTGCMDHWPATKKWTDLNYLLKVAGNRTVPIELGSHYVDENWSQKLMLLQDFISRYYLSESGDVGYLAQHNLFDQITELKEDIHIPDYCCLSLDYENTMEPDINAWLGPKGTVSPLHYDPKNNFLAQVYGTKQIILFPPSNTPYLYCHEGKLLNNTAQVNPLDPDLNKFPEFPKASMYKCLLEPGEMLFIPVRWWHHVTALDKSFSVSFWWQ